MWSLFGTAALLFLLMLRPQEFIEPLAEVPLLHLSLALAGLGLTADMLMGHTSMRRTPITGPVVLFYLWTTLNALTSGLEAFPSNILRITISVVVCLLIAHGIPTLKSFDRVAACVLAGSLVLAAVGVHQGISPRGCLVTDEREVVPSGGTPDGRACQTALQCATSEDADPNASYLCERLGLFGTTSIDSGRVRYRGELGDPNELALLLGISLPFAFALGRRRKTFARRMLTLVALGLFSLCIVLTGSRSGQLVVVAVLATYFVSRTGLRGAFAAGLLAIPALLYGGREGVRASSSTVARLECWYEGVSMFRDNPLTGVGHGLFMEHHHLTAHNAYLLVVSELGALGLLLFCWVLYLAFKIPLAVLKRYPNKARYDATRAWAMALLASLCGLCVGSFFLSLSYHFVLWTMVGLSGALYMAVRRDDRDFRIVMRARDYGAIGSLSVAIVVILYAYTRLVLA